MDEPFGVRVIHEKEAIIRYLSGTDSTSKNQDVLIGERRRNIQILINLLREYEAFELRIAPKTTPFEFQINGLRHVLVRARLDVTEPPEPIPDTGNFLRYMSLIGEENVLPFLNRI